MTVPLTAPPAACHIRYKFAVPLHAAENTQNFSGGGGGGYGGGGGFDGGNQGGYGGGSQGNY